jgi:hypothetical protein
MPSLAASDFALDSQPPRESGRGSFLQRILPKALLAAIRRIRLPGRRAVAFPSVGLSVLPRAGAQAASGGWQDGSTAPAPLDATQRRQMREELTRLLDHVPSARQVFKPLGVVERALASRSDRALDRLPTAVMQQASEQIDRLGRTEPGDVLHSLRQRLCLLSGEPLEEDDAEHFAFEPGRNVEVQDISLTRFMEVDQ